MVDDPSVQVPAPTPVEPVSTRGSSWKAFLFSAIFLLILVVIAFVLFKIYGPKAAPVLFPGDDINVSFVRDGVIERFTLKDGALQVPEFVRVNDASVEIVEQVPTGQSNEFFVIAHTSDTEGDSVGIVKDGRFSALTTSNTEKAGLTMVNGLAIFATVPAPIVVEVPATDDDVDPATEEHFEVVNGTPYVPPADASVVRAQNQPELFAVARNKTVTPLGEGWSPRATLDGSLVAISSRGIVKINPVSGVRNVLLGRTDVNQEASTVSPDASRVALVSKTDGLIEFFSIADTQVEYLGLSKFDASARAIAFIDAGNFLVRIGTADPLLYHMPTSELTAAAFVTSVAITQ